MAVCCMLLKCSVWRMCLHNSCMYVVEMYCLEDVFTWLYVVEM